MTSNNLKQVLSPARLSTYENYVGGDTDKALNLYLWNANISGSFLPCLHICEVSMRNAVSEALTNVHGSDWPWKQRFLQSLPNPGGHSYSPRKNLESVSPKHKTVGKVIPEMNFVFWQTLFTRRHDDRIWNSQLKSILPFLPAGEIKDLRKDIYEDLEAVRKLRNRIAHHEPIFTRNLHDDLNKIKRLVGYRCSYSQHWLSLHEKVTATLDEKPAR